MLFEILAVCFWGSILAAVIGLGLWIHFTIKKKDTLDNQQIILRIILGVVVCCIGVYSMIGILVEMLIGGLT
jgi:hypothetical protein